MKNISILIILLVLCLFLCACGSSAAAPEPTNPVVATEPSPTEPTMLTQEELVSLSKWMPISLLKQVIEDPPYAETLIGNLYRFDGIVYSVFVSLGFAAYENILYVFSYGLSVALPRALLAIPGHLSFSIAMGIFYGRAKRCWERGHDAAATFNLILGYVLAVLLHGFYDACAMIGSGLATVVFLVFVVLMFLGVYRALKREAARDMPV